MLAQSELALVCQEAEVTKEAARAAEDKARAAEDVVVTAVDSAQDIRLQAGFKVLRQALLQIKPGFNIDTLDTLATPDRMIAAIAKADVEQVAGQTISEAGAAEGSLMGTQVAVTVAPVESEDEVAGVTPIEDGARGPTEEGELAEAT